MRVSENKLVLVVDASPARLKKICTAIEKHGFKTLRTSNGIMALFPHATVDAVRAAIAMQKEMTTYNKHRARCDYPPIRFGIGIHLGDTIIGTIGENERMDVTVISDAVNIASRLESMTKEYEAEILVSGQVARAIVSLSVLNCIGAHLRRHQRSYFFR